MNREIKFRAWDKENKIMIDHFYLFDDIFTSNGQLAMYSRKEDWVVMQYTGLKDKNGKEIYKGDIVRSIEVIGDELGDYTEELKQEVFFNGCAFYPVCTAPSENWEVIGNIYENSNLLNNK